MTIDAVAEVDSPGEGRWRAVGVIGKAGEEAADAADRDAEGERNGVEIAGRLMNADVALHQFYRDEAEDQRADNGFTSQEEGRIVEVTKRELGIFEPEEELGSECGSGDSGGNYGPADGNGKRIAEAMAKPNVKLEGDEVGEGFKEDVRMDDIATKVDVDGELCREMSREWDEGLYPRRLAEEAIHLAKK
jgi:hypothetical protein